MENIEKLKKLREETGLSISECKNALEKSGWDLEKAKEILREWGKNFAQNKEEKETKQGIVASYIHSNQKVGAMVELFCETDFVAKSPEFKSLAHEICLQVAASPFEDVPLLEQPWIKDPSKKIQDLIDQFIAKFGESIKLGRFVRFKI
jgi:elongation factor Ts